MRSIACRVKKKRDREEGWDGKKEKKRREKWIKRDREEKDAKSRAGLKKVKRREE